MAARTFQAPKGTRDFYPIELARRRFIEDAWRKVAVRHGFEEIDGPTFEHTDLYTAKSGEGIVGEIFGAYSGKDEAAVKQMGSRLAAGERGAIAPFALRPEFTPTLARMYAARAAQLPKPCKWFWQGPCYRAENPQRGRLREFWQWNCDVVGGDDGLTADAEVLACAIDLFAALGLKPSDLAVRLNDRRFLADLLGGAGVTPNHQHGALALLDARAKLKPEDFQHRAAAVGLDTAKFDASVTQSAGRIGNEHPLSRACLVAGLGDWVRWDLSIVRGLAYYTGMVFEVHEATGAERAIAGGGRYDNLIETFGGPPTPAVGFGMGDVVLSLVIQDKGLMPSDRDIARALGLRPDVFVISNGQPESDAQLAPLLARLRREGKHARRSYKSTKNIGKLLKEAADADARFAIILEGGAPLQATWKSLDDGTQDKGPLETMLARITPK